MMMDRMNASSGNKRIDSGSFTPGVITGLTNHFTGLPKREEMLSIQTDHGKA